MEMGICIADNYNKILKRVSDAAIRSGRNPEDITLIAVSKTKPIELIKQAVECGAMNFGENRVQELKEKYEYFNTVLSDKNIKWHQIGRLQKNKVKYIVGKDILIHSVDSLELANEISRLSCKADVITEVLLQINISAEESKAGVMPEQIYELYEKVDQLPGIKVKGLMTVPEKTEDCELLRKLFSEMNEIFVDIFGKKEDNISNYYLSMGMSNDFEIAIECGSNMVRVGTAIFGAR